MQSNIDERIQDFMKRKADLTKDVRFKKLRTIKWNQMVASNKQELLQGLKAGLHE